MRVEIDTHTHTLASGHAYNTVREMVSAAKEKGLKAIAITEHAPEMPGSCHKFYFVNLRVLPRELYGIKVLFGAELNIMDAEGNVDLSPNVIKGLDITIASMHPPCYKGEKTLEEVTKAYINIMEREDIDIIGHPDDGRFPVDYEELVKAAIRTGTLLEINNSSLKPDGYRANTKENALRMLEYCKKYEAMIVLGSDAHFDTGIADYSYAEEVLREADFPNELIANTTFEKMQSLLKRNKK